MPLARPPLETVIAPLLRTETAEAVPPLDTVATPPLEIVAPLAIPAAETRSWTPELITRPPVGPPETIAVAPPLRYSPVCEPPMKTIVPPDWTVALTVRPLVSADRKAPLSTRVKLATPPDERTCEPLISWALIASPPFDTTSMPPLRTAVR